MKTLNKIFTGLELFCYGVFLGLLFATIINVAIKVTPNNLSTFEKQFFYAIAMVVAVKIYTKTYKYLID